MRGKVRPNGRGKWFVEYADQGGLPRRETVDSEVEAVERLGLRMRQVADGTFSPATLGRWKPEASATLPGARRVAEVIAEVLRESEAHLRSARDDRRYAEFWTAELGTRTLGEVTVEDVLRWRRRRIEIDHVRPATVNRAVSFLRKVFYHAMDCGYCTTNPVGKSGGRRRGKSLMLAEDNERVMVLLLDQQAQLRRVMDPRDYRIVVLFVQTGLRAGNLLGLRREWVELERHLIRIPHAQFKGKREHVVRLDSLAEEILREIMAEHDGDWLFPSQRAGNTLGHVQVDGWSRHVWDTACKRAGIVGLQVRDLRATCGTRMLERGATVEEVRDQLGHTSLTVVMRYLRIVQSHRRSVMEQMAADVRALEVDTGTDSGTDAKAQPPRRKIRRASVST